MRSDDTRDLRCKRVGIFNLIKVDYKAFKSVMIMLVLMIMLEGMLSGAYVNRGLVAALILSPAVAATQALASIAWRVRARGLDTRADRGHTSDPPE